MLWARHGRYWLANNEPALFTQDEEKKRYWLAVAVLQLKMRGINCWTRQLKLMFQSGVLAKLQELWNISKWKVSHRGRQGMRLINNPFGKSILSQICLDLETHLRQLNIWLKWGIMFKNQHQKEGGHKELGGKKGRLRTIMTAGQNTRLFQIC